MLTQLLVWEDMIETGNLYQRKSVELTMHSLSSLKILSATVRNKIWIKSYGLRVYLHRARTGILEASLGRVN